MKILLHFLSKKAGESLFLNDKKSRNDYHPCLSIFFIKLFLFIFKNILLKNYSFEKLFFLE